MRAFGLRNCDLVQGCSIMAIIVVILPNIVIINLLRLKDQGFNSYSVAATVLKKV